MKKSTLILGLIVAGMVSTGAYAMDQGQGVSQKTIEELDRERRDKRHQEKTRNQNNQVNYGDLARNLFGNDDTDANDAE